MENVKLAVFEDGDVFRQMVQKVLEKTGRHTVVAEAVTLDEALAVVDQISQGLEVDAVLVDGNLSKAVETSLGHDALKIVEAMKAKGLTAKIIGFSSLGLTMHGIPVDIDLGKSHLYDLPQVLDEL